MDGRRLVRPNMPPIASAVAHASYCFPPVSRPSAEPVRLICAGREHCLPGYHVSRSTTYPCLVTELVFDGKGKLRLGGAVRDLYPGVIFTYGLHMAHDLCADPNQPMKKYFVSYTYRDDALAQAADLPHPGDSSCTLELSSLQTLFEELIREGQRSGSLHESITAQYLRLILLKAAEAAEAPSSENGQANGGAASYERALEYVDRHFLKLHNLADLSKAIDLDATYICRLFRRFGRETPLQCITRYKLNRAAELLLDRSKTVKQIASEIGYVDQFHFARRFKNRFGHSPKQFRDLMRTNVSGVLSSGKGVDSTFPSEEGLS